jgi:hypothetical protein
MIELTNKELCYLWDALYCMTGTQRKSCSDCGGNDMHEALMIKLHAEIVKRGLA